MSDQNYPRALYRCPGPEMLGNPAVACEMTVAADKKEQSDLGDAGWHLTLAEASAAFNASAPPTAQKPTEAPAQVPKPTKLR